jgi:hypothetical protein
VKHHYESVFDDEAQGQADLKRIERGIALFQRSNNQYFKRAVYIYAISLAVLEVVAFLVYWYEFEGYYSSRALVRLAFPCALIPVAFYFFFEWVRNNYLSKDE